MRKIRVTIILAALLWVVLPAQAVVTATYNNSSHVPVTSNGYVATGETVSFSLNYAPEVGTELMVVKNTALAFISGTFDNLAQNQTVTLSYAGIPYDFVANYYGGSGNDLVLVWKSSRVFGWGRNSEGQLGDNTNTHRTLLTPVVASGLFAGKTVVAVSTGGAHSLALCSDGTVVAWGYNASGQLGNNTLLDATTPVAVSTANGVSALYGKMVVSIAAGSACSLALCSDGTVVGWGNNIYGQLGDTVGATSMVPVAINTESGASALHGKTVVAISAGYFHCMALCSDGKVVTWGTNDFGQLGINSIQLKSGPVAVNTESGVSALYGKSVVAVSAGYRHSLVICSDGMVVAWGDNDRGKLGINSSLGSRLVPVAVNTENGVSALYNKTVVAISTGQAHSLALCSDGSVTAWGGGAGGPLGDNTNLDRIAPVAVNTTNGVSALYGKTVVAISAGSFHSMALCSDGTVAAWGFYFDGQLGYIFVSEVPEAVSSTTLALGEQSTSLSSGMASHSMALVAAAHHEIAVFDGSGTGGLERQSGVGSGSFTRTETGQSSGAQTYTIQNSGTAGALTGIGVTVAGSHPGDFVVTAPGSTSLNPWGTTTFTVTFTPTGIGARSAVVQIANNDGSENPFLIAVNGIATAPLASWRSLYFGTSANAGNAANSFDFDNDGLVNLIEYAFGSNATMGTSAQLPQVQRNGSELAYSFTAPDHVVGISYGAEWSTTLAEGDWHIIPDTGIAPQHQFSVDSAPDTKMFIRFRITAP